MRSHHGLACRHHVSDRTHHAHPPAMHECHSKKGENCNHSDDCKYNQQSFYQRRSDIHHLILSIRLDQAKPRAECECEEIIHGQYRHLKHMIRSFTINLAQSIGHLSSRSGFLSFSCIFIPFIMKTIASGHANTNK